MQDFMQKDLSNEVRFVNPTAQILRERNINDGKALSAAAEKLDSGKHAHNHAAQKPEFCPSPVLESLEATP